MTDPQDDDVFDPKAFAAEAEAAETARAERERDEEIEKLAGSPDLQQAMRDSGARQIDDHAYATNQGTVILMSPADQSRVELSDRLQRSIDRTRKWGAPGYLAFNQHALRGRGK